MDKVEILILAVIVIVVVALVYLALTNYIFTGSQGNNTGGAISFCTGGPCPSGGGGGIKINTGAGGNGT